jgi:hypothetical protein
MPERRAIFRWAKFLAIAILGVLLAALGILVATMGWRQRELRAPDGTLVKLEHYHFRPGTTRYYLLDDHNQRDRTLSRAMANALPQAVTQRFKRFFPAPKAYMNSEFPGEPCLSVAFSTEAPARNGHPQPSPAVSRVVVSDDHGQSFDPSLNEMGAGGIFALAAYPRRGKALYLRPMLDGNDSGVVFRIANPCPGPHPVWKSEPMPASATNSSLEVILESLVADPAQAQTVISLRMRVRGQPSAAWLPVSIEVSDATGNHWTRTIALEQSTNGLVNGSFLGALWPEEAAWKLRVKFKSTAKPTAGGPGREVEFLAKPRQLGPPPSR